MKQICFFGIYDKNYSRNRILRLSFEANGFHIFDCCIDPKENFGFKKYLKLLKLGLSTRKQSFDFIFVPFPGHTVVWLARLIFDQKIIFDAFLSLWDSNFLDRKIYKKFSLRYIYDLFLDWSSSRLAHLIVLDTYAHIDFFAKKFGVSKTKMVRVLVGASEDIFYPREKNDTDKIIHFHGYFIPLHGLSLIVEAANLLKEEEIKFNIIGRGQEYLAIKKLVANFGLKNIELINSVSLPDLPNYIKEADICLGIFGDAAKTQRVIPNKIYEYAAMGKAIITLDTPAIKEVFTPNRDILLCEKPDPHLLAEKIKFLMIHQEKKENLAKQARATFETRLQTKFLLKDLFLKLGYIN